MIKKYSLILIYTLLFIFFSYILKIRFLNDYISNIIIVSFLFSSTIFLINNRFLNIEHFIECEQGDIVMEPKESYDYIDPSIIESKLSNLGFQGCRYPFNPKYIPSMSKKWCLKSVLE